MNDKKNLPSIFQYRDYEWIEAKTKAERKASCHISPCGRWYNVLFGEHFLFTKAVAKQIYGYKGRDEIEAENILKEKGWLWIHDDIMNGTIVNNQKKMNLNQYKILKESFGNQPLFRGWTIDAMYDEARST